MLIRNHRPTSRARHFDKQAVFLHSSSPEDPSHLPPYDIGGQGGEEVCHRARSGKYEEYGEHLSEGLVVEADHVSITDGRDGNSGHIEGIEEACLMPPYDLEADSADKDDHYEK